MRHFFLTAVLLCLPFAARAGIADLQIDTDSISFSDELIAGSEVRMYAQIINVGDEDVSGYVSFFQGSIPIDDSRVISVRAGGVPEEVFVDFIVPSGSFNVRAEIRGTDPEDQNSENDTAMTPLFTPVQDDDRDDVENDDDNCPNDENGDQADADLDGAGDACDEDDDGDGLTDEVETELGTSLTSSDSDGDGVGDSNDAFPTDGTKTVLPRPATVAPVPASAATSVPTISTSSVPSASLAVAAADEDQTDVSGAGATVFDSVDDEEAETAKAIFLYERLSWNTYGFTSVIPETDGYQYSWDFGDGVTSSRAKVQHAYATVGSFTVTYRVTDPSGESSEDTATIHVPFWTLQNRVVDLLLGALTVLLLLGIGTVARFSRRPKEPVPALVPTVVLEDEEMDASGPRSVRVRNLDIE